MRILTFVFAVVLGLIGGSYAQGPGPETIRSKEFVLVDAKGRKRGEWTVDSSGQGVLRMFDNTGTVIWSSARGPRLLKQGSFVPDR
ncbi:MAG: hypothetical protein ACLPWF_23095 [Bryobacteraceae bacterium]|jgi:hypothetical protein